jgi:hypothetical protein
MAHTVFKTANSTSSLSLTFGLWLTITMILVEDPPHTMAWSAIHDCLSRATAGDLPLA